MREKNDKIIMKIKNKLQNAQESTDLCKNV